MRQPHHAEHTARVLSGIAERSDEDPCREVGDAGVAVEIGGAGDIAFQLKDAGNAAEIAVCRVFQPVQGLQGAYLHLAGGFGLIDFRTDFAEVLYSSVFLAQGAREIDRVAIAFERLVIVGRAFAIGQGQARGAQAVFGGIGIGHRCISKDVRERRDGSRIRIGARIVMAEI